MRIMGIDPGIAITGYGIIERKGNDVVLLDCGSITTCSSIKIPERLSVIYNELTKIITEFKPSRVAIEELFFNKNAKTVMQVGQARGVSILAAANKGVQVWEYTPLEVKQSIVGYGRASKEQVQEMVRILLNLKKAPKPDDVSDALAIALCHSNSYLMEKLLSKR